MANGWRLGDVNVSKQACADDRSDAVDLPHPGAHNVVMGVDVQRLLDLDLQARCLVCKPVDHGIGLLGLGQRPDLIVGALPVLLGDVVVVNQEPSLVV